MHLQHFLYLLLNFTISTYSFLDDYNYIFLDHDVAPEIELISDPSLHNTFNEIDFKTDPIQESSLLPPFSEPWPTNETPFDSEFGPSYLQTSDPFELACSSSSSTPVRKLLRARQGTCDLPTEDEGTHEIEIDDDTDLTNEEVRRYWCSETAVMGFRNIPVCSNDLDTFSSDQLRAQLEGSPGELTGYGFRTVMSGTLSMFLFCFLVVELESILIS
jgi:hypothetical protein